MEQGDNPNSLSPEGNTNPRRTVVITLVTTDRNDRREDAPPTTEDQVTLPRLRAALEDIGNFEFDPEHEATAAAEQQQIEDEAIAAALVMFSPTAAAVELPRVQTEPWLYKGRKPDPISIGMARKLLAAALAEIPCEYEAAGDHGYAWMIEDQETWLKRGDVCTITVPTKPSSL